MRQQWEAGDVTALGVVQEVAQRRRVASNQSAQVDKTLGEREEEVGARLAQRRTGTLCEAANNSVYSEQLRGLQKSGVSERLGPRLRSGARRILRTLLSQQYSRLSPDASSWIAEMKPMMLWSARPTQV